jgi:hypothetical protein
MRSLKRSATGPPGSNIAQKRKFSNPSLRLSTILTQDGSKDASSLLRQRMLAKLMLRENVSVHCIHKHSSACSLLMKICCSCADMRPKSHAYVQYVDGRRYSTTKCRSMHYCFGCQGMSQESALYESRTSTNQNQHIGETAMAKVLVPIHY